MVGNSVKSDILPVLAIGAAAVHVPYSTEWIHEKIDRQPEGDSFFRIENIGQLPDLLAARPDLPRSGAI
jgi:putative hydrolase of the HAD superfamily